MMPPAVTIHYSISPPDGAQSISLAPTATIEVVVKSEASSSLNHKAYYDALKVAVAQAKAKVGEELTVWRDAVGNLEKAKEVKKKKVDDDDEEDEDVGEGV